MYERRMNIEKKSRLSLFQVNKNNTRNYTSPNAHEYLFCYFRFCCSRKCRLIWFFFIQLNEKTTNTRKNESKNTREKKTQIHLHKLLWFRFCFRCGSHTDLCVFFFNSCSKKKTTNVCSLFDNHFLVGHIFIVVKTEIPPLKCCVLCSSLCQY